MAETLLESAWMVEPPDISQLITEDDTPVDNVFSAKQQRLLVEPLYSSWNPGCPFFADANVGIFSSLREPPIVPDMFLSLDVQPAEDLWAKEHRSYFLWEFGKPPEVVVEIVSNTRGGEIDKKFRRYARLGVWYYLIFDPQQFVPAEKLRVCQLSLGRYVPKESLFLEQIDLGVTLWDGVFEGRHALWLRWCDSNGQVLPTGFERVEQERRTAEREHQRAERLAAQLRALGIEPDSNGDK